MSNDHPIVVPIPKELRSACVLTKVFVSCMTQRDTTNTTIPLNESDYKFVKDFMVNYFGEEDSDNIVLTNLIIKIFGLTFEENIDKAAENSEKAKNIADLLMECKDREDNDLMIFDFLNHYLIRNDVINRFNIDRLLELNNVISIFLHKWVLNSTIMKRKFIEWKLIDHFPVWEGLHDPALDVY